MTIVRPSYASLTPSESLPFWYARRRWNNQGGHQQSRPSEHAPFAVGLPRRGRKLRGIARALA